MHNPQWAQDHSTKPAVGLQIRSSPWSDLPLWFSFSHEHEVQSPQGHHCWGFCSQVLPLSLERHLTKVLPEDEGNIPWLNFLRLLFSPLHLAVPSSCHLGSVFLDHRQFLTSLLWNFSLALDDPSWLFPPLLTEPLLYSLSLIALLLFLAHLLNVPLGVPISGSVFNPPHVTLII